MTTYKAVVITLSDGAHQGKRLDTSGQRLAALLRDSEFDVIQTEVLPDDKAMIASSLAGFAAAPDVDLIVTTGGTGLGPRDVTPEATLEVIDREIPGMAEAMRMKTLEKTPMAMTSRQVVGVSNRTLIVNFPGSPKAVEECFDVVRPVLHHVIRLIHGHTEH
ncbi:MogA/MoaB family molybdenum cofactor biosynthesis protein [Alicyclobacillus fastidiosus]|uniref:MogA/MoaB family molybdenum cofactor biosynthesis protein n=1 Tax=Alicyclobacillus fastidiosus TaxID=392011 RepID=A0ABY6ZIC2_9BACL|nr:MogA/MoaB family molybdenum cofactor biosynthesis protein [Alicyclobacillus fastidiosus]WAH42624.1 MogA/MoaB family molybdenum cofactor biosynthesis protein [Alicyclobacillus fastidiosus]GMA64496.1 molybdenum cofactor biosynthesis protein [Alicyclobacillus fastidiosus]